MVLNGLQRKIMGDLQQMLHEVNPYISQFKALLELPQDKVKDLKYYLTRKKLPKDQHKGIYNLPTSCDEVALIELKNGSTDSADFQVYLRGGGVRSISTENQAHDPLHFTLLFPKGTPGWTYGIITPKGRKITPTMWYNYQIQVREEKENGPFNTILRSKRLFQEYCCSGDYTIEVENLKYIKLHQKELRADKYFKVQDAIDIRENLQEVKKNMDKIVLPSTYKCSPRWYVLKFHDAMAICRSFGKPTLFLTMTANPKWPEITGSLHPGETSHDRPDLVARVFMMYVNEFMEAINKKGMLGRVKGLVGVIEFQKRGLPHLHCLTWLIGEDCPKQPQDWDKFISAEIPDKHTNPKLYELVDTFMVHGPCGHANPNCPCMEKGKCTKKYPKPLTKYSMVGSDGYPVYKRRSPKDGGRTIKKYITSQKKEMILDNSWIVEYNPALSLLLKTHVNVAIVESVGGISYLFLYFHKGSDRTVIEVANENDEVEKYLNGRYRSSSNAIWNIFGFKMHWMKPTVHRLPCHLPNEQSVFLHEGQDLEQALENKEKTELTQWFKLNQDDEEARQYFYVDILRYYLWDKKNKIYKKKTAMLC